MSRDSSRGSSFSPVQRRACVVLVCCVLAVVASFVGAWVLLPMFLSAGEDEVAYDPALYPLDTASAAVLPQGAENPDYMSGTVFVGDRNIAAMQRQNILPLDNFVGSDTLTLSNVLSEPCVYFIDDPASYTVPQAIVKMKPRRLVLAFGAAEAAQGQDVTAFISNYRQAVQALAGAYSYSDIILCAVPPVPQSADDAIALQTRIDQYNQALVTLCGQSGYKFLNTTEVLKASSGFAEKSYLDGSGVLSGAGGNALLMYFRQHPLNTEDRRPDTADIPHRAAQVGSATAAPTATPTPQPYLAVYTVDDTAHGTLQTAYGGGQSGMTRLELEVPAEGTAEERTVTVEAVPAEGWAFAQWSDGLTDAVRVDPVTKDLTVTAQFADARVAVTLDRGDVTINVGDTITVNGGITLGGQPYTDGSLMQWIVNDDYPYEGNGQYDFTEDGFTFTFTPRQAGSYVICGGAEINGGRDFKEFTVTVNAPRSLTVSSNAGSAQVNTSLTLTAARQNLEGTVQWHCDQVAVDVWSPSGDSVTFSAANAGTYHIYATCDGVTSNTLDITVTAPPPAPTDPPADPPPAEPAQ